MRPEAIDQYSSDLLWAGTPKKSSHKALQSNELRRFPSIRAGEGGGGVDGGAEQARRAIEPEVDPDFANAELETGPRHARDCVSGRSRVRAEIVREVEVCSNGH